MKANLDYREIQKNIRKKALLESASLPPRMQTLQNKEKELKQILKSAKNKVIMIPWCQNYYYYKLMFCNYSEVKT